jgi:Iap family predicted aminopeptidase
MKSYRYLFLTLLACLLLVNQTTAQQAVPIISTLDQIKEEFATVPCKDADRLSAVRALFERMGATDSDISLDKFKNVENLVVRKSGASEEIIVIGAHYDKVSDGCGAVDNWTGIVALGHLYRTLKDFKIQKTLVFVAFGKEEKGLYGSRAMVDAIAKDRLLQYCAMVNIDSFGLAHPQVLDNVSDKDLTALAAAVAKEMKIPFAHASVEQASADSHSFLNKKIPAVTLHGLSDEWPSILHSSKDQVAKVNAISVYLGYRLALAMIVRIDQASCDAYR